MSHYWQSFNRRVYSAVIVIVWGGGMYGTGDPHFYVLDDCFAFEQKWKNSQQRLQITRYSAKITSSLTQQKYVLLVRAVLYTQTEPSTSREI